MEVQNKNNKDLAIEQLVAMTSSCLLNQMRYYDSDETRRQAILNLLKDVEEIDPQFILKLAVYLRRQLGLRTTPNFIIAYCACSRVLSKFLQQYFSKAIILPSDTIEVTQFVQIIHLLQNGMTFEQIKDLNKGDTFDIRRKIFMPNQLKKVLTKKILTYSEHQLGKYCSDAYRKAIIQEYIAAKNGTLSYKAKLRKIKKEKQSAQNKDISQAKSQKQIIKAARYKRIHKKTARQFNAQVAKQKAIEKTFLTMKDIIGLLHLKPTILTSAVIGVKYPANIELFQKRFGQFEKFDETLIGKRMKIKTPITWETELSNKGNNKQIWQALLNDNKVPYLALLRNLRNIVKVNVSHNIIEKVASFISNKETVLKNKSTPLQYLSAYQIIHSLYQKSNSDYSEYELQPQQIANAQIKVEGFSEEQIENAKVLSKSILVALEHSMSNVEKLKGNTLVFTDVSGSMKCPISGGKKYGSIRTCADLSILLGLMINQNCNHCKYYIFSSVGSHPKYPKCYLPVWDFIKEGSIMDKMKQINQKSRILGGGTDFPTQVIKEAIKDGEKIDNIIILSDMMISNSQHQGYASSYIEQIQKYKQKVNKDVKIFSIDLKGYAQTQNHMQDFKQKNFIRIYGGNASILKFISQAQGGQIQYIRNYSNTLEK